MGHYKHKKAAIDAKRAKAFAKFIKAIEVAARMGGADISGNPALDLAVSKAKKTLYPTTILTALLSVALGSPVKPSITPRSCTKLADLRAPRSTSSA